MAKFIDDSKLERKVLMVVSEKTPELIRSTANLQNVLLVRATYLSVYYILNADKILVTPAALEEIKNWLTKEEA